MPRNPVVPLTAYQRDSFRRSRRARFFLKKWARQTGKTFDDTLAIVDDCFSRRTKWVILSRGERQSKHNMEQAAIHCQAYGLAAELIQEDWRGDEATYKSLEIRLSNKSSIIGLPANPDTARGFSANVSLDEFAFHKDSRKIWTALFPIVTRGYRLRVSSTPQGKQNKFYDLDTDWSKRAKEDPRYDTFTLDIHAAIAGGLELRDEDGRVTTPEDLRAALGDDDAFDQEYRVLYLDEATAFLTYELIASAEDPELEPEPLWVGTLLGLAQELHAVYLKTKVNPPTFDVLDPALIEAEHLYLGMDIGRRRDLSVIWLNRDRAGVQETAAVIVLRKCPFFVQKVVLFSLLAHPAMRRGCLDKTGLGMQLSEEAVEQFGEEKVEGIDFTNANKELLATTYKQRMEDGLVRVPAEPRIRNSFHSIRKLATGTGHVRFDADRTEATGHADDFWASALASHAASAAGPPVAVATQEPESRDWTREREAVLARADRGDWRREHSRLWGVRRS